MFGYAFVNQLFLWGLAAASVPIIIHFLFKAKKEQVIFSSIKFILASTVKKSSRIRFRELILLLLRIAIFCLITLAFARPFLQKKEQEALGLGGSSDVIMILDDSYSTQYRDNNTSRFDRVKTLAIKQIKKLRPGDRACIMRMSGDYHRDVNLTPNFGMVERTVKDLKPSAESCKYAEAIRKANSLLKDSQADNKIIILISDFQKVSWFGMNKVIADLDEGVSFRPLPIDIAQGEPNNSPNLAVLDVSVPNWGWVAGKVTNFVAKIGNFSKSGYNNITATLVIDNEKVADKVFSIKAGEVKDVNLQHFLPETREVTGYVSIGENDRLTIDDKYYFHLSRTDPIKVLCVENTKQSIPDFQETLYLRTALNPFGEGKGTGLIVSSLIGRDELDEEELSAYDVLVLANVEGVTENQSKRIEQFVRAGGGLIVFVGDNIYPDFYNEKLYKIGVLPCKLLEPRKALGRGTEVWHLDEATIQKDHYIFEPFFERGGSGDLTLPWFEQTYSVEIEKAPQESPDSSAATVLAKYTNGDPAIIEKKFGNGKTILFTFTCNAAWTNFPKKMVFLPLVHQVVRYLSKKEISIGRNLTVRQPITIDVDKLRAEKSIYISILDEKWNPKDKPQKIEISRGKDFVSGHKIVFKDTLLPGIYKVSSRRKSKAETLHFAVNLDTTESDLTPVEFKKIAALSPDIAAQLTELAKAKTSVIRTQQGEGPPGLWRNLFIAALALMLIELIIGNKVSV